MDAVFWWKSLAFSLGVSHGGRRVFFEVSTDGRLTLEISSHRLKLLALLFQRKLGMSGVSIDHVPRHAYRDRLKLVHPLW